MSGVSKSISTSRWKPECGAISPQQSPSSTRIGFRTLMNLRGMPSSRMPASSIASTKAAALPSMIGTSLLSISM